MALKISDHFPTEAVWFPRNGLRIEMIQVEDTIFVASRTETDLVFANPSQYFWSYGYSKKERRMVLEPLDANRVMYTVAPPRGHPLRYVLGEPEVHTRYHSQPPKGVAFRSLGAAHGSRPGLFFTNPRWWRHPSLTGLAEAGILREVLCLRTCDFERITAARFNSLYPGPVH